MKKIQVRDIKFPELEELGIEWIKIMTKVSVKMIKEKYEGKAFPDLRFVA